MNFSEYFFIYYYIAIIPLSMQEHVHRLIQSCDVTQQSIASCNPHQTKTSKIDSPKRNYSVGSSSSPMIPFSKDELSSNVIESGRYGVWEAIRLREESRRLATRKINVIDSQMNSMLRSNNHDITSDNHDNNEGYVKPTATSFTIASMLANVSSEDIVMTGFESNWNSGGLQAGVDMSDDLELVALCLEVAALKGREMKLKSMNNATKKLLFMQSLMSAVAVSSKFVS